VVVGEGQIHHGPRDDHDEVVLSPFRHDGRPFPLARIQVRAAGATAH
jgi:hypothetical protein